jgi:hypothetical protein
LLSTSQRRVRIRHALEHGFVRRFRPRDALAELRQSFLLAFAHWGVGLKPDLQDI